MLVRAVMYKVRASSSPQARLCGLSGSRTVPRCSPRGESSQMPDGPHTYTLPAVSTLSPSMASSPSAPVMSKNTSPPVTQPPSLSVYLMTTLLPRSQLPTYRWRSSGDNATPFGPASSAVTSDTSPLRTAKTPLNGSSFFGSANIAGRPNGGSVKYRVPSEAYTRTLGLYR